MPPMECVPEPQALECAQHCPEPPSPEMERELWELEVLQWGLACRALHNACVEATTE